MKMAISIGTLLLACSSRMHGTDGDIPARPTLGTLVDREGRPLTANALLGPLAADDVSDRRKEAYNRAARPDWPAFAAEIRATLGLYDGFDGTCGNQWAADRGAPRYQLLATTLADDRLWIDTSFPVCNRYLAVELAALGGPAVRDCGGRTPAVDAVDVFRSLLVLGQTSGVEDGVARDDRATSTEFPFLAPP